MIETAPKIRIVLRMMLGNGCFNIRKSGIVGIFKIIVYLHKYKFLDGTVSPLFTDCVELKDSQSIDSILTQNFSVNQIIKDIEVAPLDLEQIPCDILVDRVILIWKLLKDYSGNNLDNDQINSEYFFKNIPKLPLKMTCSKSFKDQIFEFNVSINDLDFIYEEVGEIKTTGLLVNESNQEFLIENQSLSISITVTGELNSHPHPMFD